MSSVIRVVVARLCGDKYPALRMTPSRTVITLQVPVKSGKAFLMGTETMRAGLAMSYPLGRDDETYKA
jgi:hypothetical protein